MMMMTASFVASAQIFSMEKVNHSLSYLILTTDSTIDRWRLPFPVYQFCVGDVDHDGNDDALVGVEKTTRFDSEIKKIIQKSYDVAEKILKDNLSVLHKVATSLLEKEKLSGDEFKQLLLDSNIAV